MKDFFTSIASCDENTDDIYIGTSSAKVDTSFSAINIIKKPIYGFWFVLSAIGQTLKEKVFPKTMFLLEETENEILKHFDVNLHSFPVPINEKCTIWTWSSVSFENMIKYKNGELSEETIKECKLDKIPLVFIHGFASGTGLWSLNFDMIKEDVPIFSIDLPGFAHSSRIDFPEDHEETEKIFIDCIETWRDHLGLENMLLVGHSMGGYLSTAYALQHPNHIKHLLLVDPWGFPDLKETVTLVLKNDSSKTLGSHIANKNGWTRVVSFIIKPFSPLSLMRFFGSVIGPTLIQKARPDFYRRYLPKFGEDNIHLIYNYIFLINSFNPTGEAAFRSLAHPLGWAKNPILPRINNLAPHISIRFCYGACSWISSESGFDTKEILKTNDVFVDIIDEAGHHVYADKPKEFNKCVIDTLEYIRKNDIDKM